MSVFSSEPQLPDLLGATIGDFGKWQCRISIFMALLKFPIAWFQLGIIFLAPPTDFWCRQPEDFKLMSKVHWKETIKHHDSNFSSSMSSCYMKNVEYSGDIGNKSIPCKWGYEYDQETMMTSIISEWNLVCGQEFYVDLVQMTFMCGVLLGSFIFGILADRYGRKTILVVCIVCQSFFGVVSAISPWYTFFLVTRFLIALSNGGTVIISFVMCMEITSGKWRTIVPILYQIPFGIGNTIMAGLAYLIRDWRELQLVLSCLSAIYIIYIWFLPESPRWLVAIGKKDKAVKVLETAIRFNKSKEKNIAEILDNYITSNKKRRTQFVEMFKKSTLRNRIFLLCVQWLLNGIVFYAFMQFVGQLGKNLFLNVALGGLVAIPGTFFCILIVQRVGRKWTIVCSKTITSFCLAALLFIPLNTFFADWPRLILAGAIIINLSISTSTLFLFTGELFPTVIRNAGVGACVVFFKIGSILAPLVITLQILNDYLPLLVMSLLAITQAIVVYPLPESKDTQLPDTMKDIELRLLNDKPEDNSERKQLNSLKNNIQDDNSNIIM